MSCAEIKPKGKILDSNGKKNVAKIVAAIDGLPRRLYQLLNSFIIVII